MTALQHGVADWLCRQAASDMAILLLAGCARRILATAVQLPDRRSDAPPPFPEGNVQANLTRRFPKIAMSETRRKTACRSRRYFAHNDCVWMPMHRPHGARWNRLHHRGDGLGNLESAAVCEMQGSALRPVRVRLRRE